MDKIREIKARSDLDQAGINACFEKFAKELGLSDAEKAAANAKEEEKKAATVVKEDDEWNKEDIAELTKAIQKFPPGTAGRWKVIAEFCGHRSQKDVIKKAQELSKKREIELEESRAAAEAQTAKIAARVAEATLAAEEKEHNAQLAAKKAAKAAAG